MNTEMKDLYESMKDIPLDKVTEVKKLHERNMSYCRFENTYNDLRDCYDWMLHPDSSLGQHEQEALPGLVELCRTIAEEFDEDQVNALINFKEQEDEEEEEEQIKPTPEELDKADES
jgi:hypothetical protein